MSRTTTAYCLLLLSCAGACDNIGRAFDPSIENPSTAEAVVEVVPRGGDVRDGRPKVKVAYPSDAGWPATVPILVEFSESVNQASIAPTTPNGSDGRIILRVVGTTQPLPCQYTFLAQGRLLLMRPLTGLSGPATASYEVVLLPDARDCDGVTFQVEADGTVLTTFQANQDESFVNGRIVAVYPRNNVRDISRESVGLVFFDRPADSATLRSENVLLRPQGGVSIAGELLALSTAGVEDTRIVRFTPSAPLAAATRYEWVVNDSVTFGPKGVLDFGNKTPFSRFTTITPAAPAAVVLGNPTTGFPNKINRANQASAVVRVTTAADALVGDRVLARIYGGDARSSATGDIEYVEHTVVLSQAGAHDADIDFSGTLGTLTSPVFDDGSVTFAVQTQRGSEHSGFLLTTTSAAARFDITQPTLLRAGPASSADGHDLLSDVEAVAFYGTASEAIADATLVDGLGTQATLFLAGDDGAFLMQPLTLGRLTEPRSYSLTLTDRAGNISAAAATGNIVQRGLITGTLNDTLTVEAFDQATLLPIANATVLVDPATPTRPATNQLVGTTDASGRATFDGLGTAARTITIVRAGYDLITMYATQSAYVSLPLRPLANSTATFRGTATLISTTGGVVTPPAGTTVIVGNNTVADRSVLGIRSAVATPNTIPDTAIVPNRPQLITAFAGAFAPTVVPTFAYQGVQLLGQNLLTPSAVPPAAPAPGGSVSQQTLGLIDTAGAVLATGSSSVDFASAQNLDTANLVDGLQVRVTASVPGFIGQVLTGIGVVSSKTGTNYTLSSNFGLLARTAFEGFVPNYWLVAEARDTEGRISRHRAYVDPLAGAVTSPVPAQSVPVITVPGGPSAGSPAVTVADVLDESIVFGGSFTGEAVLDVTATDAAGRRWLLLFVDRDTVGGSDTLQFPDLATPGVASLQAGPWQIQAEARVLTSVTFATSDDMTLTERIRQEVVYSRSAPVTFTIQ